MDADELRKTMKRLDAMSDRCDHVISRNRPLTPDTPPRQKANQQIGKSAKPRSTLCGEG
jgi:hypothetical protein